MKCPRRYRYKGQHRPRAVQDGTALLFQPGNGAAVFVWLQTMTARRPSWSYGKYFSDLGCAFGLPTLEIIADPPASDGSREDIRESSKRRVSHRQNSNVQSVIMGDSRLWERPLDRDFRDNMIARAATTISTHALPFSKENGNFKNVDTAMPVESLDDLEQYRSDRLTDKVTSLKDSLDAQYKADERGRVFDRPCQVI